MFNTNWPLNPNSSASNVDWSALADSWMQQREQQAQWQQPPPPLPPPPPPPPQFLLGAPPIPPPGLPPIGMTFPPLPSTQHGLGPHHHQLQVGSNTTQESLTMTNIENAHWRPQPPPTFMMSSGPQWRPNTNYSQPLFPVQQDIAPSFGGRNFWPPGSASLQIPPPPPPPPHVVPTPVPPPPPLPSVVSQSPQIPLQFPVAPYQHSTVDKRIMNTSFNTSIPSLMDLPSSYGPNSAPPPPSKSIPPVPMLPIEPSSLKIANAPSGANINTKRRKIPAWLRAELGRIEKEKEKKIQNTSNNNLSINDLSSKFDDDDEDEDNADENGNNTPVYHESTTVFNDDETEEEEDDDDDEEREANGNDEDEESSSTLISSTPVVNRRSRFDDDKSTEQHLNVSAISKRTYSPSPPPPSASTTLIEDDQINKENKFMMKLHRALTELLLEVTNEELVILAKEVYLNCKAESSTPVIRKASGLTSLIQSFSGSDSEDEEEKHVQSIVNTTVISKSAIQTPVKQNNISTSSTKSTNKTFDDDDDNNSKSNKNKKKKSTREKSPSLSSSSHDYKDKKHHHKKHRHRSSSSSSPNSSQSRSQKKKKSSNHDQYSEYHKSKKYDDRGRKR